MSNLVEWIEGEAGDEQIEAVVIGGMGWSGDYKSEGVPNYFDIPKGEILSWEEARPWLDYEFSSGYGAPGCNAIWAWTETKVIAIAQYDGATWPYNIPRHPMDAMNQMPEMEGGGG